MGSEMCIRDRGVEDAFDIEIPQEEAEKIVTVADAIDLIQRVVE